MRRSSSWNSDDLQFLQILCGECEDDHAGMGEAWHVLKRDGRVLLLLPRGRKLRLKGLGLYQPQSGLAQMVMKGLRGMVQMTGQLWGLPELRLGKDGVLAGILRHRPGQISAILLGNSSHDGRRAIVRVESSKGDHIWKIGFSGEAKNLVIQETRVLRECASAGAGIPDCLDQLEEKQFAALCLPFFEGGATGWDERRKVADLLKSWLGESNESPNLTRELQRLSPALGTPPKLDLRSSICHGDFAAWNVLKTATGGLRVIDWEMGRAADVPGWDLVHWLIQPARLVQKLPPQEVCETVREQLQDEAFEEYLQRAGWSDGLDWLLGSYLAHYEGDSAFDTTELLEKFLEGRMKK